MAAKGYDDSPPRNGIIFFYTVLTVCVLIGVKLMLDSYFAKMMDAEVHDKILSRGMEEVAAMREQEKQMLEKGSMPVEQAMKMLAQRGRSASPMIAPESGQGKPEVAGWSQLKREVKGAPAPAPAAPAAPEAVPPGAPATPAVVPPSVAPGGAR